LSDPSRNHIRPDTGLLINGHKNLHVHPAARNSVYWLPRHVSTIIYRCIAYYYCCKGGSTGPGNYGYHIVHLGTDNNPKSCKSDIQVPCTSPRTVLQASATLHFAVSCLEARHLLMHSYLQDASVVPGNCNWLKQCWTALFSLS
jgi:hypothetical protein